MKAPAQTRIEVFMAVTPATLLGRRRRWSLVDAVRGQDRRADSGGSRPGLDLGYDFQLLQIDRNRVVGTRDCHVHELAVGRRRHPVGRRADLHRADVLQVRQRPPVDATIEATRCPHRGTIRQDLDAVHVASLNPVRILFPEGQFRRPEHVDDLVFAPVDDPDRVDARSLREHALGGTVGVGLEGHWPHLVIVAAVLLIPRQFHPPDNLVLDGIDHLDRRFSWPYLAGETGDDEVVIRRHVGVVHWVMNGDAANQLVRGDVNDVHDRALVSRPGTDACIDFLVLLVDHDLVGIAGEANLRHELQRLRVEHVDGILRLVRAVVVEAIRVSGQIVRIRTTPDESRHPVGRRIDDVMDVSCVVALEDSYGDTAVGVEPGHALCRHQPREDNDSEADSQRSDQR